MKKENVLLILSIITFLFVLFTPCPENYGTPQTINGLTYIPWVVPFSVTKFHILVILSGCIYFNIICRYNKGEQNEESTNHS